MKLNSSMLTSALFYISVEDGLNNKQLKRKIKWLFKYYKDDFPLKVFTKKATQLNKLLNKRNHFSEKTDNFFNKIDKQIDKIIRG